MHVDGLVNMMVQVQLFSFCLLSSLGSAAYAMRSISSCQSVKIIEKGSLACLVMIFTLSWMFFASLIVCRRFLLLFE